MPVPLPVSEVEPGPMGGDRDSLNWAFLSWAATGLTAQANREAS